MNFELPCTRLKLLDGSYHILNGEKVVKHVDLNPSSYNEELSRVCLATIRSIIYLKNSAAIIVGQDLEKTPEKLWSIAWSTLDADWEGVGEEAFHGDGDNMEAVQRLLEAIYNDDMEEIFKCLLEKSDDELFKLIDPKIDAVVLTGI